MAIEQVVIPRGESVELLPRPSQIMLLQRDLIQKYKLRSEKIGREPDLRLRILPFQTSTDEDRFINESYGEDSGPGDFICTNNGTNGISYTVDRLPLLPE